MSIYSAVLSDKDRGLRLAEVNGSVDEDDGDWDADEDVGACEFDAEFVTLR